MIDIILRATLTAAVAQGTPLLLTALGEIMNQRAGVLNLGLDGMMLFGAVTAFISLIASGSLFVAVLVGGVCAALLALIHAFLSVTCRVHQVICGLALNIFAAGFSAFVGKDYNGIAAPKVLENIRIPLLADIPYLGEIFFNQNLLVYLSYALVIVLSFVMFRTQIGLKMRACGENPSAAYSTGVNVNRTRYIYVMIGGFLAGIGGSFLILSTIPDVDGEHDRRPRLDLSGHRDLRHVEALSGDDHGLCFRRYGGAGLPAAGHQHRSLSGAAENAALFGHGDRFGHRIHRQP